MEVQPEVACPLCLDLLSDPVLTPCRHTFCRLCITRVMDAGHGSCPLCRGTLWGFDPSTAVTDSEAVSLIASTVPEEVLARRRQEGMRRLEIVVGNLYEEVASRSKNKNKWTMYTSLRGWAADLTTQLIDKVVYDLHPTFNPSVVTAHKPNFSVCRFGWGTFPVGCKIHWNPRLNLQPLEVDHWLDFDGEGGRTIAELDIEPEVLEAITASTTAARPPRNSTNATTPAARRPSARRVRPTPAPTGPEEPELIEVVVANSATQQPDNRYRWSMSVFCPFLRRSTKKMIDSVTYELHPTFNPPEVTCTAQGPEIDFKISRIGWGTFPVKCKINWNSRLRIPQTEIIHELNFDEGTHRTAATVSVSPSLVRQVTLQPGR
mmetsp:Transcript_80014/g.141639  ORF Transcript_80014/g.141639 Transcript_80014/m.141639 type:complete len:376 (-) Transcript_80014:141-1268(-)